MLLRSKWINFIFITAVLLFAGHLAKAADLSFTLTKAPSNLWENEQFQNFIRTVQNALPDSIKQILRDTEVEIEFVNSSENPLGIYQLDQTCDNLQYNNKKDDVGEDKASQEEKKPRIFGGKLITRPFAKPKIQLNLLFWIEILQGPDHSHIYKCGHRTGYRAAMATLIHEIGHLYDEKQNLSRDRRFLHLMTFSPKLFGFLQKNDHSSRSTDIYELTRPAEAFAINLEYFIMDPEFKCRRPTLYQFYKENLNVEPYKTKTCTINRSVVVNGRNLYSVSLDENRLYRVDYLLAGTGAAFESRFGHSMIRLVFCEPGKPKTSDCLNDVAYHVVVSFRARVNESRKSDLGQKEKTLWDEVQYALKGLGIYGRFPSEMFLLSMRSVIAEYNNFDFRDLISSPLNLTELEKKDLLNRILEINWGYSGSYQFFTNNCRSETEDLIKAIIRSKNIENVSAITPVGLREELYNNGFAFNNKDFKEITHRSIHYYTKSALEDIKTLFTEHGFPEDPAGISEFLKDANPERRSTLETYVNEYSPEQRNQFINALKIHFDKRAFDSLSGKKFKRLALNLSSLEYAAQVFQDAKMDLYFNSFYSYFLEGSVEKFSEHLSTKEIEALKSDIGEFKKLQSKQNKNRPELTSGYGIPWSSDWKIDRAWFGPEVKFNRIKNVDVLEDETYQPTNPLEDQAFQLLKKIFKDEFKIKNAIKNNVNLLTRF